MIKSIGIGQRIELPLADSGQPAYMALNSGALDRKRINAPPGNTNGPRARFFVPAPMNERMI